MTYYGLLIWVKYIILYALKLFCLRHNIIVRAAFITSALSIFDSRVNDRWTDTGHQGFGEQAQ